MALSLLPQILATALAEQRGRAERADKLQPHQPCVIVIGVLSSQLPDEDTETSKTQKELSGLENLLA